METEFEVKFYPVDKEKIRKLLKKLGAKLVKPERKMRRAIADRVAYPDLKCDFLRVRDKGGGEVEFSIKVCAREDGKVSDQKELCLKVDDFEKTTEAMGFLGYKPNRYQETLRETWQYDKAEIVIDTWPGLDPYIEIEAASEDQVKKMAEGLGLCWKDKLITSVVEIFAKVYNLTPEEVLKRLDYITFEKVPF